MAGVTAMDGYSEMERDLAAEGYARIAGVDEAGRGPLAGPVVAAAVVFAPDARIEGVADSKTLRPARRATLYARIMETALSVGIGIATHEEIDALNILQASLLAMRRAIDGLALDPGLLLIDGNRMWQSAIPARAVVRGDARCFSIAAASIVAKETRDDIMDVLDVFYPAYGFARNKGYPTAAHREAVLRFGPSPVHRASFRVKPPSPQIRMELKSEN